MQDNDLPFDDFLPSRWRNDEDDDFLRNSKNTPSCCSSNSKPKERLWSDRSMSTGETQVMDDEYNSEEDNIRKMKQQHHHQQQKGVSHNNKLKSQPPPRKHDTSKSHHHHTSQQPPARREAIKEQPSPSLSSLGRHLQKPNPSVVMGAAMGSSSHSGLASIVEEDSSESETSVTNSPVINERDREFLESIKSFSGVLVASQKRQAPSSIQSNTVATNNNTEQNNNRKQAPWLSKPAWARRVSLGATGAIPHTPLSDNDSDDHNNKKNEKSNRGLLNSLLSLGDSNKDVSSNNSPGDDKSVESAGLNLRGDLRQSLLKMNSVMNKSAMFSMTPEELQVREMRPWRKQSQLRSAKASMQAAALAVHAEFGEEDSDADDNKSEVDSVCYRIPDDFQRTPKPEQRQSLSNFDDLWSPPGGSTPGGPKNPFKQDVRTKTQNNTTPEKAVKNVPREIRKKNSEASPASVGKAKGSAKDTGESGLSRESQQRKNEKQTAVKQDQMSSTKDPKAVPQSLSNVDEELEDLFALMKLSKEKNITRKDEKKSRSAVEPTKPTEDKPKTPQKKVIVQRAVAEPKYIPESAVCEMPESNAVAVSEPKIPPKKYKREEDPKLRDLIIDTDDSSDLSSLSGHFGNTRSEPTFEIESESKPIREAPKTQDNNDSSVKHRRRRKSLGAMETSGQVKEARDTLRRMSMGLPQTSSGNEIGRSLEKPRHMSLGFDEKETETKKDKKKSKKSRRSSLLATPEVIREQKADLRMSIDVEHNEPEAKDDSKRTHRSRRLSLEAPKADSEPKLDRRSAMARSRSRSESAFRISSLVAKKDKESPRTEREARMTKLAPPKADSFPRMDRRAVMARARSRSESAFQVSPREREPRMLESLTKADTVDPRRATHVIPLVNAKLSARDTRSKSSIEDLTSKDERSRGESKSKKKKKKKDKKERKSSKEKTDDSSSRISHERTSNKSERFEFLPREPSFKASSKRSQMTGQVPLPFFDPPPSPRAEYKGDRKLKLEKARRKALAVNPDGEKERSRERKKESRKKDKESRFRSGRMVDDLDKQLSSERRHSISVPSRSREVEPEGVARKDLERKSKKRESKKRSSSLPSEERSKDEQTSHRSGSGRDAVARPASLRSRSGSARSLISSGSASGGGSSQKSPAATEGMFTRRRRLRRGSM